MFNNKAGRYRRIREECAREGGRERVSECDRVKRELLCPSRRCWTTTKVTKKSISKVGAAHKGGQQVLKELLRDD
jgi:hypothetical protein